MRQFFLLIIMCSFCLLAKGQDIAFLLKKGIHHYDQREFDLAESYFLQALDLDKKNAFALYELAYTYATVKRYDEAARFAKKGLRQKGDNPKVRRQLFALYGSCLEKTKSTKQGIKQYQKGLVEFSDYYLLHFNLGVAQLSEGNLSSARSHFVASIEQQAEHSSSHYYLSLVCKNLEERVPAILSGARFLYLEPTGPRAELMRALLPNLIRGNLEDGQSLDLYEGPDDFYDLEMILDLSSAQQKVADVELTVSSPAFLQNFNLMCQGLGDYQTRDGFFWSYYAPYFSKLRQESLVDVFTKLLADPSLTKIDEWKKGHASELKRIRVFTENYSWK